MKLFIIGACAALAVAGCSSSGGGSSNGGKSASPPADSGQSCQNLVGKTVAAADECTVPITGLTAPTEFPCYDGSGSFYYFRLKDRFVYGLPDGEWRQRAMPANGSLGEIAADLGC